MIYNVINHYSTNFFLDKRTKKSNGHPIICRITMNRKKVEFKIGFNCQNIDWDEKQQKPKNKSNGYQVTIEAINKINGTVASIVNNANISNKQISSKKIKEIITGKTHEKYTVLNACKEVINHYKSTNQAPVNQQKIKNTLDYLERFLIKIQKTEITLEEFTKQMVKDFEMFLTTDVTYGNYGKKLDINTIAKHMSRFKTFWKHALNSEWTSKDVISGFKIKKEDRKRQSLNLAEFKRLRDLNLNTCPEKERVRDAFIFCCYTGLRFEDSQSNIALENFLINGEPIFKFRCSKNKTEFQVPLLNGAIEIFNKYQDANFRVIKKKILPPFTNQHANRILKTLALEAKIDPNKKLTFHLSRHTCAQLQFEAEIDEKVTGAWLGHISNSITSKYQNDYNKRLKDAAVKFERYINSNF